MSIRYRSGEGELIPIIVLIIANVLVYIAVNIANLMDVSLIPYLGLGVTTFIREPWTIFTYMFTHRDFMHLLANMLTLYFYGSFMNRITGAKTFLTVYFVGGLVAGLFVLLLALPPYYLTIGASGAIFALGGVLTVLTPQLKVFIFPIPAPMPLWVAIVIGFLVLAIMPNVSWQGHLGGLVFGLLAGWYLRRRLRLIL
jgi:membrane associated rhomboid family serine protease